MIQPQAPKHTALREALTDVMLLLDGLAGDGVGNTVSEGQTLWADTVYFALIEALGFSSDDDTPTAEEATAILLSAIEPDPSSSAQKEAKALREYAFELTKAFTSLTAGGSEYFGRRIGDMYTADIPFCLERIRESKANLFAEMKDARRQAAREASSAQEVRAALEWRFDVENMPKERVVEACARSRSATTGFPQYVVWYSGGRGGPGWYSTSYSQDGVVPLVCWAWRERPDWPPEEAARDHARNALASAPPVRSQEDGE